MKKPQIKILAQLNLCNEGDIKDILSRNGVVLQGMHSQGNVIKQQAAVIEEAVKIPVTEVSKLEPIVIKKIKKAEDVRAHAFGFVSGHFGDVPKDYMEGYIDAVEDIINFLEL